MSFGLHIIPRHIIMIKICLFDLTLPHNIIPLVQTSSCVRLPRPLEARQNFGDADIQPRLTRIGTSPTKRDEKPRGEDTDVIHVQ